MTGWRNSSKMPKTVVLCKHMGKHKDGEAVGASVRTDPPPLSSKEGSKPRTGRVGHLARRGTGWIW
jgi:hypothetical protein